MLTEKLVAKQLTLQSRDTTELEKNNARAELKELQKKLALLGVEESAPEVPDSESKRPKRTAAAVAESGQGWVSGGDESSGDDDDDDGTSDDGSEKYDDDDEDDEEDFEDSD